MTAGSKRPADPDAWGVLADWVDADQQPQRLSAESVQRLRSLIGQPPEDLERHAPIVTRPGRDLGPGSFDIVCEDGTTVRVESRLPADFPCGYHLLRTGSGEERQLIVSPGQCWSPQTRAWGWSVQLYALRSRDSWGIGDLADLRKLKEWARQRGAGFLLVNPLHAVAPGLPQQTSPYLPVTRRFRNPIYLRVEEVPGADRVPLADLTEAGQQLTARLGIDYDAVWTAKTTALERIFATVESPAEFDGWRREQGRALEDFATWCALVEHHGPDWRSWAELFRHPDAAAVQQFRQDSAERVTFHAWLQWALDVQLRAATGGLTVIQDLPIGVDGGGADAWAWQGQLVSGALAGAPPDSFNSAGQDWGSPPFNPWRLRADGYRPFIASVRSTMAGAGGLRIDHVLGLFRLWWVPADEAPLSGGYVRYPSAELLDIVALESARASALVVGEDLGTIEPGVREALAAHRMLSYRLLWFEAGSPATWPSSSMAAVTTHDLPTVAGLWTGSDLAEQREFATVDDGQLELSRTALLARLAPAGLSPTASAEQAVLAAYKLLASSPSTLLCATLEDAVLAERRPNLPGVTERANWCIPLPVSLEELVGSSTADAIALTLQAAVGQARR